MSSEMAKLAQIEFQPIVPPKKVPLVSPEQFANVIGEATVKLAINTKVNGKIIIRNVPVWILEEPMDEVLLGEDVLLRLGISVPLQLVQCGGKDIDFIETDENTYPDFGGDDEELIRKTLKEQVKAAFEWGLNEDDPTQFTSENRQKWMALVDEHADQFRTMMGFDPPADLEALKVDWDKSKASSVRPIPIKYSEDQKAFMDEYCRKLEDYDYIYENGNAKCVSESLVLPKNLDAPKIEDRYRLVCNLKRANAVTKPKWYPLPTIEELQTYLNRARYILTMDCKNGYWQIKLHKDSQPLFSFSTHRTVYSPTRVPHGAMDAVMHFTHLMMTLFKAKVFKGILPFLDDLLLYSETLDGLYDIFKWTLERARAVGIKFSAKKLNIMADEIKWCGKVITRDGVKVDPLRQKALLEIPLPTTAAELMQLINATNWIRVHLTDFAERVAPLQDWLNGLFGKGKRTSKRAKHIKLDWTDELKVVYQQLKQTIANATMQSHPDDKAEFILCTDASDRFWGGFLGQIKDFDETKFVMEQEIEPLYFLSGRFRNSQLRYSTSDKEACAIHECVTRLRHLLVRERGFRLMTDHKNLTFRYGAYKHGNANGQSRIDRWALKLQEYKFDCEHIDGENHHWPDLLSRWGAGRLEPMLTPIKRKREMIAVAGRNTKKRKLCRHEAKPVVKPLNMFEWPTVNQLKAYYKDVDPPNGKNYRFVDGIWYWKDLYWIPDTENLRHTMMIIAHYGIGGHNDATATKQKLMKYCYWVNMDDSVKLMIDDCVLCRCTKATAPPRVHLGLRVRPSKPNLALHFDYYTVGESRNDGPRYLLAMRDGFSRYVKFHVCKAADAACAVEGLLEWIAQFGVPHRFYSDNGPHFRNSVMKELSRRLALEHEYSTVYCAWTNGLIERVLRDVKALFKIVTREARVDEIDWPILVPNVTLAINARPSRVLEGQTPIRVHTGLEPTNPLDFLFDPNKEKFHDVSWTPDLTQHVDRLTAILDEAHQKAFEASARVDKTSRKKAETVPEFEIGDYVLYSMAERPHPRQKIAFQWVGPCQIVDMKSKHVYVIRELVSGKLWDVHVTRLSFYSTDRLNVSTDLTELISRQNLEYNIDFMDDIIWDTTRKDFTIKVHWSGFSEHEASYEPFGAMLEQVPLLVLDLLNDFSISKPDSFTKLWNKYEGDVLKKIRQKRYVMDNYHFIK